MEDNVGNTPPGYDSPRELPNPIYEEFGPTIYDLFKSGQLENATREEIQALVGEESMTKEVAEDAYEVEEVEDIIPFKSDTTITDKVFSNALVGKVINSSSISIPQLKSVLPRMWNLRDSLDIIRVEEGTFVFIFANAGEKERIGKYTPWVVLDQYLILMNYSPDKAINDIDFTRIVFWIQARNLSPDLANEDNAMAIGNKFPAYEAFEIKRSHGICWTGMIRLKVAVDVNKPLKTMFRVLKEDDSLFDLKIVYERLKNFCYNCGRINHIQSACTFNVPERMKHMYGPSLRAEYHQEQREFQRIQFKIQNHQQESLEGLKLHDNVQSSGMRKRKREAQATEGDDLASQQHVREKLTKKRKGAGSPSTGLGISDAKEVIEARGSRIKAVNMLHKGNKFQEVQGKVKNKKGSKEEGFLSNTNDKTQKKERKGLKENEKSCMAVVGQFEQDASLSPNTISANKMGNRANKSNEKAMVIWIGEKEKETVAREENSGSMIVDNIKKSARLKMKEEARKKKKEKEENVKSMEMKFGGNGTGQGACSF